MYGKEIKLIRKNAKITQMQVAKGTGLPQSTISWIEKDDGIPNIEQCVKLADFYGISLDELVGRHTIPLPKQINQTIHDNHGTINNKF